MRARTVAAAFSAALSAVGAARAEGDVVDLEGLLERPVVSTASKVAEAADEAPATVSTITAEDLRRHGVRTLDEALNFLSLGMMATNPLHHVEVGARGVMLSADYGNHVLLLLDGHALNEQLIGNAYFERGAGIPMELVDHIEIMLGPGSVLYGSNAMLGVINVVTKRAKDYAGARVIAEAELATSARAALGAGYEFELFGRRAEFSAQAEYFAHEGPSFSFGPQDYGPDAITGQPKRFQAGGEATGVWGGTARHQYYTRAPAAYGRLRWGDVELGLRASAYERGTPYLNYLTAPTSDFDRRDNRELDRLLGVDLKHHATIVPGALLRSRLYADSVYYIFRETTSAAENCPAADWLSGCRRRQTNSSRWAGVELQGSFDWLQDGRFTTLVGADARLRHVGMGQSIRDNASDAAVNVGEYVGTDRYAGVYVQQTLRPADEVGLNAGARLDADQRFGSNVSPRLAATYRPWRGGTLKAVYAEAFRTPSAFELNMSDPSYIIPSPGLRPEKTRSVEASIEQRFGRHRVLFGAFTTYWRDMIGGRTLDEAEFAAAVERGELAAEAPEGFRYDNIATIRSYGYNATFEGALVEGRLRYALNLTGAQARRYEAGAPASRLGGSPQAFGNARVSYDFGEGLPTAALAARFYTAPLAAGGFDDSYLPQAQGQLELRTAFTGDVPGVPGLSYRVTANYALASHSPYLAGPVQYKNGDPAQPEFAPVDRFRTALGLQYVLPP